MGSCYTPGVPLCELAGRQPSITWCDDRGEPRAGYREEKLETHEAASYHGQLSRLHHSPKHNRGGDRTDGVRAGYREGDTHGQVQSMTVSHPGQRQRRK